MGELTSSRRYGRPCCTRTKAHNPAAPPGIAGLIAALSGLANSQFPLASPSRPDAAKPPASRRLRLYDGALELDLCPPALTGNVVPILSTAACLGGPAHLDRKRAVEGKGVAGRANIGGLAINTKQTP